MTADQQTGGSSGVATSPGKETATLTERVVSAVAAETDSDPVDLPPLYDAIDTDALNSLFESCEQSAREHGYVTFPYADFEVTAHADNSVTVTPLTDLE